MAPPAKLVELVNQLPEANKRGMLHTIEIGQVEKIIEEIHKGGRESVIGLIDMLLEPGQGTDYKAWYALHCLAVRICKQKDKPAQKAFCQVVASQIGGDRPKGVQERLIQTLQVAGDKDVVAAIGKTLTDEKLCEPATQALLTIGAGAAEQLRAALPKVRGARRLTILQALGVLKDAASAPALRAALTDASCDIRLVAAAGLANIGDAGSVDLLLKAADAKDWERVKATKACLVLAENLKAAGKADDARKIYTHLRDTRTDPAEKYIKDVAEAALA